MIAQFLEVAQFDHSPVARRELQYLQVDALTAQPLAGLGLGAGRRVGIWQCVFLQRLFLGYPFQAVEADVHSDLFQPRDNGARPVEILDEPEGAQEGILGSIFSIFPDAKHSPGDIENYCLVPVNEFGVCLLVFQEDLINQFDLIVRLHSIIKYCACLEKVAKRATLSGWLVVIRWLAFSSLGFFSEPGHDPERQPGRQQQDGPQQDIPDQLA